MEIDNYMIQWCVNNCNANSTKFNNKFQYNPFYCVFSIKLSIIEYLIEQKNKRRINMLSTIGLNFETTEIEIGLGEVEGDFV